MAEAARKNYATEKNAGRSSNGPVCGRRIVPGHRHRRGSLVFRMNRQHVQKTFVLRHDPAYDTAEERDPVDGTLSPDGRSGQDDRGGRRRSVRYREGVLDRRRYTESVACRSGSMAEFPGVPGTVPSRADRQRATETEYPGAVPVEVAETTNAVQKASCTVGRLRTIGRFASGNIRNRG